MKQRDFFNNRIFYSLGLLSIVVIGFTACNSSHYQIYNPYETVSWAEHKQYKANLHSHTVRSDGWLNPHAVVDAYHAMGYSILAITDHNEVTYPWTAFTNMEASNQTLSRHEEDPQRYEQAFEFEDRNPEALQMIAIQGNEVNAPHHVGNFFNDFLDRFETEEETFSVLQDLNSVVVIFHPGRYTEGKPEKFTDGWYIDHFRNFDNIVGMEIYNQGDRYPTDRALWDRMLGVFMPNRQIWAFSNDDMHRRSDLGRNWNVMILPELSLDAVRKGMEQGVFYYVYAPEGHNGPTPPAVKSVTTNEEKGTILIEATNYNEVLWISGIDTLQRGESSLINLKDFDLQAPYVRAELWGEGSSITGTQAFGVVKH
jgi:hypothetical protein